jgi:hypothetical protein
VGAALFNTNLFVKIPLCRIFLLGKTGDTYPSLHPLSWSEQVAVSISFLLLWEELLRLNFGFVKEKRAY